MLFKIWTILFSSLLLAGVIFYVYSDINVGASYRLFHVKAKNFLDFLLPVLVSGFIVSLVLGFLITLFFPHAFAGPLYRIEKELDAIGRGDLTKQIELRKGSEVKELAEAVNRMTRQLRQQVEIVRDAANEMAKMIEESSQGDEEAADKLAAASQRLQAAMKDFKL
jgi:methyl-accepting chemotaxis protein